MSQNYTVTNDCDGLVCVWGRSRGRVAAAVRARDGAEQGDGGEKCCVGQPWDFAPLGAQLACSALREVGEQVQWALTLEILRSGTDGLGWKMCRSGVPGKTRGVSAATSQLEI